MKGRSPINLKRQGGWMAAIPLIISAVGAIKQGQDQKNAADFNAAVSAQEGKAAEGVALTQENTTRQAGREAIGHQAAAIGQAGIGYGGSSADELAQSSKNAELDALNVRYRGALTKYGYNVQSQIDTQEGKTAQQAADFKVAGLAGAYLMKQRPDYGGSGGSLAG